jgi:hypothetical protein
MLTELISEGSGSLMSRAKTAVLYVILTAVAGSVLIGVTRHHLIATPPRESASTNPAGSNATLAQTKSRVSVDATATSVSVKDQTFERATNLFNLLDAADEKTDVGSITLRARVFEECRLLAVSPDFFSSLDANGEEAYGTKLPIVREYAARYLARCGDVAQFRKITTQDTARAIHAAADAGSPWARAMLLTQKARGMDNAEFDSTLGEIMGSRDADAIGALADGMVRPRAESKYSDLSGTPLHVYAWQLASCDMGRDCSTNGVLMRQTCIFGGVCGTAATYRDFLQQSILTQEDFIRVQEIEGLIFNQIQRGQ